jgi:hypothetical protein
MSGKKNSSIALVIENNYSNFQEFYTNEKHQIYSKIIDIYEEILKGNIDSQKLIVVGKIEGCTFDTDFEINKDNQRLLIDVIIPYFEKIEEYETCKKILELRSELISK